MKTPKYPIDATDHQTTDDAEEMIKLCRKGWVVVNTLVHRSMSTAGDGPFWDHIQYVLLKPAP